MNMSRRARLGTDQLAAVLVDLDTRRELASMDVIVKPTRWMPLPPPPTSAEGVEHG